MRLKLLADQIGMSDVRDAFTWGGKEYTILSGSKEIYGDTKEPTGYYILELKEKPIPNEAGPTY